MIQMHLDVDFDVWDFLSIFSNTVKLLKVIKLKIETSALKSTVKKLKLKLKTFIE